MQLDNIGWAGDYNAVRLRYLNKGLQVFAYNASGMDAMEGFQSPHIIGSHQ